MSTKHHERIETAQGAHYGALMCLATANRADELFAATRASTRRDDGSKRSKREVAEAQAILDRVLRAGGAA